MVINLENVIVCMLDLGQLNGLLFQTHLVLGPVSSIAWQTLDWSLDKFK